MERTPPPTLPRRRTPPGHCSTCRFSSYENLNGNDILFCRQGPPNTTPVFTYDKQGRPREVGRWSGVPIVSDDGWCFQYQLDLMPLN